MSRATTAVVPAGRSWVPAAARADPGRGRPGRALLRLRAVRLHVEVLRARGGDRLAACGSRHRLPQPGWAGVVAGRAHRRPVCERLFDPSRRHGNGADGGKRARGRRRGDADPPGDAAWPAAREPCGPRLGHGRDRRRDGDQRHGRRALAADRRRSRQLDDLAHLVARGHTRRADRGSVRAARGGGRCREVASQSGVWKRPRSRRRSWCWARSRCATAIR